MEDETVKPHKRSMVSLGVLFWPDEPRATSALRPAPAQGESGFVWEFEPDNGPPITGAGEIKIEEVKEGLTYSTLPLRHEIVYVHSVKETKLWYPRLK